MNKERVNERERGVVDGKRKSRRPRVARSTAAVAVDNGAGILTVGFEDFCKYVVNVQKKKHKKTRWKRTHFTS